MKYSTMSIGKGTVNFGNCLIEYCAKSLLELPDPEVEVSMFKIPTDEEIERINKTDFLLLHGSTILAGDAMQSNAMKRLPDVKIPVFAVSASGWMPYYPYSEDHLKYITPPIGVRDPHALEFCKSRGVGAIMTGCPTALMPIRDITESESPFSIVGFARTSTFWQVSVFRSIPGRVVCALQEHSEGGVANSISKEHFNYWKDSDAVMNQYAACKAVYTGRLHGVLPAISQRKPVFFFGVANDSRFTLLKYLGIPINPMEGIPNFDLIEEKIYLEKIHELTDNFYLWKSKVGLVRNGRFS